MNQNPRQEALDELLARDQDKLGEITRKKEATTVEPEWVVLAEFASYYGWDAMQTARMNDIDSLEFNKLLMAGRKLHAVERYNRIIDTAVAFAGGKSLKKHIEEIKKQI